MAALFDNEIDAIFAFEVIVTELYETLSKLNGVGVISDPMYKFAYCAPSPLRRYTLQLLSLANSKTMLLLVLPVMRSDFMVFVIDKSYVDRVCLTVSMSVVRVPPTIKFLSLVALSNTPFWFDANKYVIGVDDP
jgi:hypothetical protein